MAEPARYDQDPPRPQWHALSVEDIARRLDTDIASGLSDDEAERRLAETGPNELIAVGRKSLWLILRNQVASTMIMVLIGAALVSILIGSFGDALAILAIVILNVLLGFSQEYRAEKAMSALRRMSDPKVRVRRNGRSLEVSSAQIVPGDIVNLETGNLVPADGRIIQSASLRIQESALTGESEPVEKVPSTLAAGQSLLADRVNQAFKGTFVTYGHGVMLVTATGMQTELGRVAELLQGVEAVETPLQKRLRGLGRGLVVLSLAIAALVFLLGLLRGEPPALMFMLGVSIAVAAIPEGLPAVVTIALALGAQRMLGEQALIRRLPAVETLGSVTVICTDKTGTLTENRMAVTMLEANGECLMLRPNEGEEPSAEPYRQIAGKKELTSGHRLLLMAGALCNDAELANGFSEKTGEGIGDPTETALVAAAANYGYSKTELEKEFPRISELPFDAERKRMATVHEVVSAQALTRLATLSGESSENLNQLVFAKGAVASILTVATKIQTEKGVESITPALRAQMKAQDEAFAAKGLRVLGAAWKPFAHEESSVESDLIFLGFWGLVDPPRREAHAAVAHSLAAGIRPIMITGDHPLTAQNIAARLGITRNSLVVSGRELDELSREELADAIEHVSVFARVTPEHKLRIVEALQLNGQVVAMTGDGVNDAPALHKADIGVAMGITGTDVAKEAADMVLLDDNFATIVSAVGEGRTIYDNIRKYVKFSIAGNLGKILFVVVGPFLGISLPLMPLQVLWLNLLTDGLLGLGLSVEKSESGIMQRKPLKADAGFFGGGMLAQMLSTGLLIGTIPLLVGGLLWAQGNDDWQTVSFTLLAFSQLWQAMAIRTGEAPALGKNFFRNPAMLGAGVSVVALQAAVVYFPPIQGIFATRALSPDSFLLCFIGAGVVFWFIEAAKWLRRHWK